MTKQDMIDTLILGIENATRNELTTITLSINEATEMLSLLVHSQDNREPLVGKNGDVVFYCASCGQSFRAVPREDKECFEKWHYHRWFADCPKCKAEVMQNDRYWR